MVVGEPAGPGPWVVERLARCELIQVTAVGVDPGPETRKTYENLLKS